MERTKVPIPADVVEGLEAVRTSGKTNMLAVPRAIELAFEMEHHATALWVHENRKQYAEGIFRGFEAADRLDEDALIEMAARFLDTEGGESGCADKQE
jgi:hypothetical protein